MSRLQITYPFVFNSLSGVQPASDLDDNYDAVPSGTITIATYVKAASFVLTEDDNYSTFICVPTNDSNITLPSSPSTDYSFFFSNQSATKLITIIGTVTIDGTPILNPIFPDNYGNFTGLKGGLVIYDGSSWTLYPSLLLPVVSPIHAAGNSTGAVTVDFVNGDKQTFTLTGDVTFTFSNPVSGTEYTFELTQDGTGSRLVTWPAAVKFAGGSLTLTTTATKTDVVKMLYDGTNYRETSRALNQT